MTTYCVICREIEMPAEQKVRTSLFYLSAASADTAIDTAATDNPESQVIGIEITERANLKRNGAHAA